MKRRKPIFRRCAICDNKYKTWPYKLEHGIGLFCSKRCMGKWRAIKQFRGVKKNKAGYVFLYAPDHPLCRNDGYVKRSRLVMESIIGRRLLRTETVHHINGIKDDDAPENLMYFVSEKEHQEFHNPKGMKPRWKFKRDSKGRIMPK